MLKKLLAMTHGHLIFGRRTRVLAARIASQIPEGAKILDVGAGDGTISQAIGEQVSGSTIEGIDVFVRPVTKVPITGFDGKTLPYPDDAFDSVIFVDVLHHSDDALSLLKEAARVARHQVIIKDHLSEGMFDHAVLRAMDWVGNAPHGVRLPYNYFSNAQWQDMLRQAGLHEHHRQARLGLYVSPISWVCDRHLHMIVTLQPASAVVAGNAARDAREGLN